MEGETPDSLYPGPKKPKLSQAPSWFLLGFLLGALFLLLLPRRREQSPESVLTGIKVPQALAASPRLSDIEALFEVWGHQALWRDNRTQVAKWNEADGGFTDYYEILREGDRTFFRSIPAPEKTNLAHPTRSECPLVFLGPEPLEEEAPSPLPPPPEPPSALTHQERPTIESPRAREP